MFMNFMPMFAATDAATSESHGTAKGSGLTEFPGEEPTDKEVSDWLDLNLPILRQVYGALLRGETPSHLKQFQGGADDLTGYTAIDLTERATHRHAR